MAGNLPLLTEPYRPFLVSYRKGICVQPVLTSLENLEGELQKSGVELGGGIEDNQSKAPQQHCFPLEALLAGPYRSTLRDRIFTCATCHHAVLSRPVCQSQVATQKLKCFPYILAPPKLSAYLLASKR